jgi:hypothetical protein
MSNTRKTYATPGRRVVVRTGNQGRPSIGTLIANLYHRSSLYGRIVEIRGSRVLVGRDQTEVV